MKRTPLRKKSGHWPVIDQLDRKWREAISKRWGGECAFADENLLCYGYRRFQFHAHHIFGRQSHPKLSHERLNGILCCAEHHQRIHCRPAEWLPLIFDRLGKADTEK